MRPRTLLALLLVVPLVDALFLVFVATQLGWALTVGLVVLTAILGMLLLRAEGRATIARVQRKLAKGQQQTDELLDGVLLIGAGAFLLTPGLVTDALGFLLALPLTRIPIRMAVKKYVVVPYIDRETGGFATGNVYIGGFPSGDGDADGFGNADFGGTEFDGDGFPGGFPNDGGGDDGDEGSAGFSGETDGDDVVDVDYTVETEGEESRNREE